MKTEGRRARTTIITNNESALRRLIMSHSLCGLRPNYWALIEEPDIGFAVVHLNSHAFVQVCLSRTEQRSQTSSRLNAVAISRFSGAFVLPAHQVFGLRIVRRKG